MKNYKPMVDTNVLVYAHNQDSPFFARSKSLIEELLNADGFCVTSLILFEFFSIITDGRKIKSPLPPEIALEILEDIIDSDKIDIQMTMDDPGFFVWLKDYIHITKRYQIYDASIAFSMHQKKVTVLYTNNVKDFKDFEHISAVSPFKKNANFPEDAVVPLIPYGRQSIDEKDVAAVCAALRSDYLTTGPIVAAFENVVADFVGAPHAVAVSSGTAALHSAMYAIGIESGDEVILPPVTFAATANCIVYQGGTPVFADVEPETLLIDPIEVEKKITPNTKAIIGVDYAGQPCDWDALREIANKYNLILVADGCHALGAEYKGVKVGSLADLTAFSFHPVKHITTGEGGMITTNKSDYAEKINIFRNHGITSDHRQREKTGSWFYEMTDLGFNYRITDFQSALGISQLKKLPDFLKKRREIADQYNIFFSSRESAKPLSVKIDRLHAYHLYVVKLHTDEENSRQNVFDQLRKNGIGVNIHYIPVHLHPFYRKNFGYKAGDYPVAEKAFESILSLPMFPSLKKDEIEHVIENIKQIIF